MTIETPAERAIRRIVALGYGLDFADIVVGFVLEELHEVDRGMLDAGLEDLNLAMGKPPDRDHGATYRRELARTIWHSMLDRAR
jgi:hypothetical protein